MRSYFTLLRLPYQLQLGPIFGWGYLLAGGTLASWPEALRFVWVFLAFHIGAFGGLTALNSYFDRDTGPVGGMWRPPPPPPRLKFFAWSVQSGGLLLLYFDLRLAAIYAAIVLLALGYSHPRTRWKGHPWKSVIVVALGQGVLDFAAGALTAGASQWNFALWAGMTGATLTVIAFYPLTQLYQIHDDTQRGDHTLAAVLTARYGRAALFSGAAVLLILSGCSNALAIHSWNHPTEAAVLLAASLLPLPLLWHWSRSDEKSNLSDDARTDFIRVHGLMRLAAIVFGLYIVLRLLSGGLH